MDPYQWVNEFESRLADLKKKSEDLQENFESASATVTSKDNAVTVTVGPNGGLQNLQLGHRAVELGAPRLTALILETARQAQRKAAGKVLEVFQPLGEGTETMQMVMDSIPADPETEEEDTFEVEEAAPPPPPVQRPAPAAVRPPSRRSRPADDEDDDNNPW
ncbi:hypothetical protein Lesp02_31680 [Lentzea sp. NBRC 105346]|uniref:YbaB/EbfC family nucleoid-associated protein n=1 Tax=Lentzea sp. NBRC 105346 TaxID=3032205 RepID=UPI0024A11DA5|nr:YbaB/EbfC family nucleoid-associated protein [Lentzea sp. NBRC 105346]GLZ30979.1 hypothetical protein Lesp02_31680 [Lentzea sp. NBRC 105346]